MSGFPVEALCVGRIAPLANRQRSAIAKRPVDGLIAIGPLGLDGDTQADQRHHGGPDMAVHHYPLDHHAWWIEEIGAHSLLAEPGAFGTNLSCRGLLEPDVHLGDRFRLGTALLEVTQPRQPCRTIENRFARNGMVKAIVASGRCGWFYRVLQAGHARAGDALILVKQGERDWPIARAFDAAFGKAAKDTAERQALATVPVLAEKLRAKLER